MVKKIAFALCFFFAHMFSLPIVYADDAEHERISADQIKRGCVLAFEKTVLPDPEDPLSTPPYSLALNWLCQGEAPIAVDRYDIEGGNPQIVTVFFRKKSGVVVLVKWSINSHSSDFVGDIYKIYVYKFVSNAEHPLVKDRDVMVKLFEGWDGFRNGHSVSYPFKDAASIRKELARLGY
jgi:hypothetical protein